MKKLIGVILALIIILGCGLKEKKELYDFTQDDLFLIPNITAENISLKGIGLGATIPEVVAAFGKPDNRKELIIEGETNLEYGKSINLTDNGLIFHFDNGTLTRMTIKQPFTEHYKTKTQLNSTKREMYEQLGLPDKQTTVLTYRVFTYEKKGIDVFLKGKNVNRISFFFPIKQEILHKTPVTTDLQATKEINNKNNNINTCSPFIAAA